jgi:hypothetical protein
MEVFKNIKTSMNQMLLKLRELLQVICKDENNINMLAYNLV